MSNSPWTPMHQRAPTPGTDCVVVVRYNTMDRPPFPAIDRWDVQHEDPTGMGGPTIETGEGWNDNYDSDVIAWMQLPPLPPVDWDRRLPDATAPEPVGGGCGEASPEAGGQMDRMGDRHPTTGAES